MSVCSNIFCLIYRLC